MGNTRSSSEKKEFDRLSHLRLKYSFFDISDYDISTYDIDTLEELDEFFFIMHPEIFDLWDIRADDLKNDIRLFFKNVRSEYEKLDGGQYAIGQSDLELMLQANEPIYLDVALNLAPLSKSRRCFKAYRKLWIKLHAKLDKPEEPEQAPPTPHKKSIMEKRWFKFFLMLLVGGCCWIC